MPSMSQLEYTLAVAQHQNFGRAASACHVTQPTLSAAVAALEDELEALIFDRSAKPILVTPIGAKILDQARVILSETSKLKALAQEDNAVVSGTLSLGVIPTIAPYLIPLFLKDFADTFKEVKLEIHELNTSQILDQLSRDQIDAGILAIPITGAGFQTTSLYLEPFYVLCHSSDPISRKKKIQPSDLSQEKIWLLEEGHCMRGQVIDICRTRKNQSVLKNVSFESGSIATLSQLIEQGVGMTLVPHLAVSDEMSNNASELRLIPFSDPMPGREVGLIFRRSQLKRRLLTSLEQSIKRNLPRSLIEARKNINIIEIKN
jgi:LysR family hydrogen peroxide-inducible transcriptional activator